MYTRRLAATAVALVLGSIAANVTRAADDNPSVGALTLQPTPLVRFFAFFAPADPRRDAAGRVLPACWQNPDDPAWSDSFPLHGPSRPASIPDDAPALARPQPPPDTRRSAAVVEPAPATPFDWSTPVFVAPASSAVGLRAFALDLSASPALDRPPAVAFASAGWEVNRPVSAPSGLALEGMDAAWTGETAGFWGNPAARGAFVPSRVGPQPQIVATGTYRSLADNTQTAPRPEHGVFGLRLPPAQQRQRRLLRALQFQ